MGKENWTWMPHVDSIIGDDCQFRLCTYVNGYLITTIGEYLPERNILKSIHPLDNKLQTLKGDEFDRYFLSKYGYEKIAMGHLYQTQVFIAQKRVEEEDQCCTHHRVKGEYCIESNGYAYAVSATVGHMNLCLEYDKKEFGRPKFKLEDCLDKYAEIPEIDNPFIQNIEEFKSSIDQFNLNIECIKTHMSAQNLHNELFLKRIINLEKEITTKQDDPFKFLVNPNPHI